MAEEISISYLGWSGFLLSRPGAEPIFLDPPAKTELPVGRPIHILLSHGHPEHLAGTTAYLERAGSQADATIIASSTICRHLSRSSKGGRLRTRPARPGDTLRIGEGVEIAIFEWTHLPLLPSGLGPSLRHIAQLLSSPRLAYRIARATLLGPGSGPMLGFRLDLGGWDVLAYGEGLHRFCKPEPGDGRAERTIALAGIEPGDEGALPGLLQACGAAAAILYEPHAIWRDAFGMPRVDLAALSASLLARGIAAQVATPGKADIFGAAPHARMTSGAA